MNNKFDVLKGFIENYFHQDWDLDYPDFISVWNKYISDTQQELDHRKSLLGETKVILNHPPKEINDFLCNECDFCLGSDQKAYNWVKEFDEFLSKNIQE